MTNGATTYGPYTHMWPEDGNDIVNPGVKATNPNYDPNDPCIYAATPSGCGSGNSMQTAKYADGLVSVGCGIGGVGAG